MRKLCNVRCLCNKGYDNIRGIKNLDVLLFIKIYFIDLWLIYF